MKPTTWERALTVMLPEGKRTHLVPDARNAAYLLAEKWPVTYGRAYQRALAICASAMDGRCRPDQARLAFISAAREAQVIVS
jgi:hypothetical protein